MYDNLFNTGLNVFNKARDFIRGAKVNSLIDYVQVARVEPIVLIDSDVLHYSCLGDVQQSLLAMFAGYYLQAAAITNSIGNVNVRKRLEALNPQRSAADSVLAGNSWLLPITEQYCNEVNENNWMMSTEAFTDRLPFPGDKPLKLTLEAAPTQQELLNPNLLDGDLSSLGNLGGMTASKDNINKTVNELANLSVGKLYGVDIHGSNGTGKDGGTNKITVQVAIRLIATAMRTDDLIHILSTGSSDTSWKERWHGWKSERLSYWKDLVMCNDLIQQHRKDLMNDPSGVRTKLNAIQRGNQLSALITLHPTIASSSNMVVMSRNTADKLELQLEGKLSKFEVREKMFKNTYLMIVAIIDEDYQRVTFYYQGISLGSDVRLKDIEASNKGNGPDVTEMLKAYQLGMNPTI